MKELSIEEKAQAYDEVLKKARMFYKDEHVDNEVNSLLEVLFPELKVSEGEYDKMRNFVSNELACLRATDEKGTVRYNELTKAIDWLEKQGEHANFRNKIQVGDKVTRNEDGVLVNLSQLKRIAKPAEEYNITGIGSKNAQGKLGEMIKNLKPVNEVLEQKPWSEEDDDILDDIIIDVGILQEQDSTKGGKAEYQKEIAWLKSLKHRYAWKPSETQLETLKELSHDIPTKRGTIEEILKHLKQL